MATKNERLGKVLEKELMRALDQVNPEATTEERSTWGGDDYWKPRSAYDREAIQDFIEYGMFLHRDGIIAALMAAEQETEDN